MIQDVQAADGKMDQTEAPTSSDTNKGAPIPGNTTPMELDKASPSLEATLLAGMAQAHAAADDKPDSENKNTEIKVALQLMKRSKFHEAIQVLRKTLTPNNDKADSSTNKDKIKSAAEVLSGMSESQNVIGEKYMLLGLCYLMRDQHKNAYQCFQQHQLQAPTRTDPLFWYAAGLLFSEHQSHSNAQAAFETCLKFSSEHLNRGEVQFRIAMACKHQRKFDRARSLLESLQIKPPTPLVTEDILFHLGHIYQLSGLKPRAVSMYNVILKRNPKHATTLRQMAWLRLQEHRDSKMLPETVYKVVLGYLNTALECGNDARTLYVFCRCHLARQETDRAYEAIKKALGLDPMNPTYWFFYGVTCFESNLYLKALNAYLRVVHLNPSYPNVWVNVAKLYMLYNQTEDAILAYQQAQKREDNPQIASQILWLQKQLQIKMAQQKRRMKKEEELISIVGNDRRRSGGGMGKTDNFSGLDSNTPLPGIPATIKNKPMDQARNKQAQTSHQSLSTQKQQAQNSHVGYSMQGIGSVAQTQVMQNPNQTQPAVPVMPNRFPGQHAQMYPHVMQQVQQAGYVGGYGGHNPVVQMSNKPPPKRRKKANGSQKQHFQQQMQQNPMMAQSYFASPYGFQNMQYPYFMMAGQQAVNQQQQAPQQVQQAQQPVATVPVPSNGSQQTATPAVQP